MIYQAHDPLIDRKVAIKLIRADLLDSEEREEYLTRFQREAQAAGRCAHPNIVAIYDFSVHEGNPFLAMEYVEGANLGQIIAQSSRLPVESAVGIIAQVLDALACAHGFGIVHRDIKPANLLVQADQHVKVTDFGISRLDASGLTQAGSVVGTPSYMSPEQCRGETADERSDLFSTGIVLYELLTGTRPFAGRSLPEVTLQIMNQPTPDIRLTRPELPPPLVATIERALAKRAEDRFSSAGEMAASLRRSVLGAQDRPADDSTVIVAKDRPTTTSTASRISAVLMQQAERELVVHLGPIARILAKRAADAARSPDDFWQRLASHIEREPDRQAFLSKRPF